jgi:hypothetical protein
LKRTSPRHIAVKTFNAMKKEKHVTYKGKLIRITGDF